MLVQTALFWWPLEVSPEWTPVMAGTVTWKECADASTLLRQPDIE